MIFLLLKVLGLIITFGSVFYLDYVALGMPFVKLCLWVFAIGIIYILIEPLINKLSCSFKRKNQTEVGNTEIKVKFDEDKTENNKKCLIAKKESSIEWARNLLKKHKGIVVLDTETTGLNNDDEIIEIGILDLNCNVLFHSYIRPERDFIPLEAVKVHGITKEMLANSPSIAEIYNDIRNIIRDRVIVTYNAEFDKRLLNQTLEKYNLKRIKSIWVCAMTRYADYMMSSKWLKLPNAGHDTITDCKATIEIIKTIAKG